MQPRHMNKAQLMLYAHLLLMTCSITRIVLHQQQTCLTELNSKLTHTWLELYDMTVTFLATQRCHLHFYYKRLRQTRVMTALIVAPTASIAWPIALTGDMLRNERDFYRSPSTTIMPSLTTDGTSGHTMQVPINHKRCMCTVMWYRLVVHSTLQ